MSHPLTIVALVCLALSGRPRVASAANGPGAANGPSAAAAVAERDRLGAELDRLNVDIDALKQQRRGLAEDYQLRRKMADAEAIARRLTELDRRLAPPPASAAAAGLASPPSGAGPAPRLTTPRPSASDDRDDLEAKADILTDQARRLNQQASLLQLRVEDLRGRQELRHRVADLDRDPFSPLEQAKRRLPVAATTPVGAASSSGNVPVADRSGGATVGASNPPVQPPGPAGATAGGATSIAASPEGPKTLGATTPAPSPVPVGSSTGAEAAPSLATQFNGLLDPSTLAEIRKLEASGNGGARLPAAEKALAALRARAQQLAADAEAIRATARTRH